MFAAVGTPTAIRTVSIPASRRPGNTLPEGAVAPSLLEPVASPATRPSRFSTVLLLVCDVMALLAMLLVADWRTVGLVTVVAAPVWATLGLYKQRFTPTAFKDARPLALGGTAGIGLAALVQSAQPTTLFTALAVLMVIATMSRTVAYLVVRRRRAAGREVFPAVVVGTGQGAPLLIQRALGHPETGIRIAGWLRDENHPDSDEHPRPSVRPISMLRWVLATTDVRHVFLAGRDEEQDRIVEQLRDWSSWQSVSVHKVPNLLEFHTRGTDEVWGIPVDSLHNPWANRAARRLKRAFDFSVSGIALVALAPLLAMLAVAVRWELGPGVIFRQTRVGLDGEPFELFKFRSLRPTSNRQWSVADPDAIGPVGRFMRKSSLDELPQLLNVLRGNMSLVGPRPETPQYVEEFSAQIDGYKHRHRVPVGLTGLAACRGLRGATSLQERVYFDNHYIENWSLWLDLTILARTVSAVLRGSGS